ncbi:hypothetical protein [Dictyobacter arantiisoli]|uniref:TPM domain-containing protein n=1 Tax=Dictyobacter arantiisoli TaxID=2014874 RepID=A0A5A5TDT6_9CHLR|nr:hypothetical protein [Dictyobacter arantiisoli]GCF09356.1 hypothetical protein KDI_29200 [Dictyobacter arantiisoli]
MDNKLSESMMGMVRKGGMAAFVAFCLLVFTATAAFAASVNIYDSANVLNRSQVQNAASSLSKPIDIYSITSSLSNAAFDQQAKQSASRNSNLIVLAFNSHHVAITGGKNTGLSRGQFQDATNAFLNAVNRGGSRDYTGATIAAINSLHDALGGSSASSFLPGVGGGAGRSFGSTLCCVGLIALLIIGAIAFARTRARRRGLFNRSAGFGQQPYNQGGPFNQNQGNYPPNYQGNYPPNYQGNYPPNYQGPYPPQNQGMNPLAAGGLGAAAGGLFGYELGKNAGERDRDQDEGFGGGSSGDFGNGGDGGFGGDNGGDFGGGASGDFGGGGGDSGFGGGDGGFGGGGGDGGFGGGSSGDF